MPSFIHPSIQPTFVHQSIYLSYQFDSKKLYWHGKYIRPRCQSSLKIQQRKKYKSTAKKDNHLYLALFMSPSLSLSPPPSLILFITHSPVFHLLVHHLVSPSTCSLLPSHTILHLLSTLTAVIRPNVTLLLCCCSPLALSIIYISPGASSSSSSFSSAAPPLPMPSSVLSISGFLSSSSSHRLLLLLPTLPSGAE